MKKCIYIIFFAIAFSIVQAHAKLSTKVGVVKEGYNFWLYEPDNVKSQQSSSKSKTECDENNPASDPGYNPSPQTTNPDDYFPINLDSLSSEEQIAYEMCGNKSWADSISHIEQAESPNEGKPLVIFLHGRSLCGNNLNKVLRYGTIDAIKRGREIDAYVIAPQNPGTFWKPDNIMNVVDWLLERYPIDTNRIYVLGMSLGGYGTIDLVAAYPHRIAAAMALCGGGSRKDLSGLNEVPLWIIHGTSDAAVSVNESRKVKNKMEEAGATPLLRYDEWAGVNHGALARVFYLESTYEWLFKHRLDNRSVDTTISIKHADLKNAYKK